MSCSRRVGPRIPASGNDIAEIEGPAHGLYPVHGMSAFTLDQLRRLLPPLEELGPVFHLLLESSLPPESDPWAASTGLGTAGARIARLDEVQRRLSETTRSAVAHVEAVHGGVGDVIAAYAEGDVLSGAAALLRLAALEEGRGRLARALGYADSAVRASAGSATPVHLRALRRRARAARGLGSLEAALSDYSEAWRGALDLDDAQGAAEAAVGAGNVLEDQARWEDAERWYHTALEGMDRAGYDGPERWHALLNLSVVLRTRGELEEARARLSEAAAVPSVREDEGATVFFENAEGQWLMAAGRHEEAIDHLTLALAAVTDARARIVVRLNLTEALHAAGRTLEAAEEARRAELDAISAGREQELPGVYRALGRLAADDGSPDAFVLFERSLKLIEELRLPRIERARTLQLYADAEDTVGRHDEAERIREEADREYASLGLRPRTRWAEAHPDDSNDSRGYTG